LDHGAGVLGLIVSGGGILISHPRLYWGETGAVGLPLLSIFRFPSSSVPRFGTPDSFLLRVDVGVERPDLCRGRNCHAALAQDLLPAKADLNWKNIAGVISSHLRWKRTSADEAWTYNVVQRLTYLIVVFRALSGSSLHGPGDVVRGQLGVPDHGDRFGRFSVRAHVFTSSSSACW